MIHFMSNPCGHPHCMYEECSTCPGFKPRFLGIPVPRKLGAKLYNWEAQRFYKKRIIEGDEHIDWLEEEE